MAIKKNIFISHSWAYSTTYDSLIKLQAIVGKAIEELIRNSKQKFFHRSNSMGVRFVIHELLRTRNALIELISSLRKKMFLCFD